ncbi:MAG TPA: response regulator [Blastocatellia bacterium]|nr:response regulator [Blastocatellia bacterium]
MKQTGKRILCVEDDEDSRELMSLFLGSEGYEVVSANSAAEALMVAEGGGFVLYILDNWFVRGSGLELCRQIRAFDPHTPILFYSGAGYEADIEEAMRAGAQGYLVKPTEFNVIIETVKRLIGLKETRVREQRANSNIRVNLG